MYLFNTEWLNMNIYNPPPGSGLLSQYGHHAPGREAPQRDDRPPDEKGNR